MDGDRIDVRSSVKVMIFLVFYRFIWFLCMPFVLCFLVYRSKHEPAYAEKLLERFGIGQREKALGSGYMRCHWVNFARRSHWWINCWSEANA